MVSEDTSLLSGERRLVDAVRSWSMDRHPCDLSGEVDADRKVRAGVLKRLITGETIEWGIDPEDVFTIDLCGAHIVGELRGVREVRVALNLQECTFEASSTSCRQPSVPRWTFIA